MNKQSFKDKVVIITGSTMGIGKLLAIELAALGAKIVLNGRDSRRLVNTHKIMIEKGYQAIAVQADVTSYDDCKKIISATIDSYNRIDILVNNAGLAMNGNISDLSPEVFRKVMNVNYLGSVYSTITALPFIIKTKGNILFISSVAGMLGFPKFSAYSASKMSLTAFAEALRIELAGTGVHIGINYISFTYNEPEKLIMDAGGNLVKKNEFSNLKYHSREKVVTLIIHQLQHRKFISNQSTYGKLIVLFKSFFPRLLMNILIRARKKGKI
jgi:short-subunit dehydrogenase